MSTVEVKIGDTIKKFEYLGTDIDTMLVICKGDEVFGDEFEVKDILGHMRSGRIVLKKDVVAHYHHWERKYPEFMGMRCTYEEVEGGIRVTVHEEPEQCIEEFTFEPHYIDRGTEWPRIEDHRWHIMISAEDERLKKEVHRIHHEDIEVKDYGIAPHMSEAERAKLVVAYLQEKISNQYNSMIQLSCAMLGTYGYKVPGSLLSTNIDLVFEEIIPVAFEQYKVNYSKIGNEFLKELVEAIEKGFCNSTVLSHLWIENQKQVKPDEKYLFFMYLKLCLKLMEVHQKGMAPYNLLDLRYMSYYIDRNCSHYLEKHPMSLLPESVWWNGKKVCSNLKGFMDKSIKKLEYFRQFEVSDR